MTRLSLVEGGKVVRIVSIEAGIGLARRLMEMGMFIGSIVTVVEQSYGHIVVDVKGARFALGRGMANKIVVEVIE
ncbi:MAG: FeoA domain-containing protein [Candidatus Brockarchaeota archaeon]|nr:FeoA domain-containing protein [Candidatus Brockarchaeota archaeon]